jgi:hypothetical protein
VSRRFGNDGKTALEAKFEAQKLAFGPMMFQAARVLRDCGALEHLKEQGKKGATPAQLHQALPHLSVYACRLLLEAGLAAGMVMLEDDERYVMTKTGFFVLTDPMTRVNMDFVHDVCYRGMFELDAAVAQGRPAGLSSLEGTAGKSTVYEALEGLSPRVRESWFAFEHHYSESVFDAVLPRVFEVPPSRLLDVGGNTGKWAALCCAFDESVRVTICDHPGQLADARRHLERQGLGERVDGHAIDFLDQEQALPPGHDTIWMSQFLDCFGEDEIISILRRAAAVMDASTRLFILETFWDHQRHEAARYSVINTSLYFAAIANGNSKMLHSERMLYCLREAGLAVEHQERDIGVSHTLLSCRLE